MHPLAAPERSLVWNVVFVDLQAQITSEIDRLHDEGNDVLRIVSPEPLHLALVEPSPSCPDREMNCDSLYLVATQRARLDHVVNPRHRTPKYPHGKELDIAFVKPGVS